MVLCTTLLLAVTASAPAWAAPLPDYAELVEARAPAVVRVAVHRRAAPAPANLRDPATGPDGAPGNGPGSEPERFGEQLPDLFRRFFEQLPTPDGHRQPRQGMGSGFIISTDGYILTNTHVVSDAAEIVVHLHDRRSYSAKLIGADERTDVALIRIDADGELPVITAGDSDKLRVGQWVLAIGSPFGFDYTATQGIVSALSRQLPDGSYVPFIQTDAAINPGNSGGPLFDTEGHVIGINSQIYTRSGGYMGLSFAIPINTALQIADQLKARGYVSRGWLGVTIQDLDQQLAESFGLDRPAGALIAGLTDNGPAAAAGLRPGDVILDYDGRELARSGDLPPLVGATAPGETVELQVLRGGARLSLEVRIGELEEDRQLVASASDAQPDAGRLGLAVAPLDEAEREQLGIDHGVRVQRVDPRGPAARAGIRSGDVIASFNRADIDSPAALREQAESAPADRALPVLVFRSGSPQFLAMTLPQA